MRIIFIRHGDPDYVNDTLTEKGWREAKCLAERVKNWKVDDVYCSPLGRAKDTASLSLKELDKEATICDWMQEFFVPVKDPETGNNRIAWDFMPKYWTNEKQLFDKDEWVKAPVMQTGHIEEAYANVCGKLDELLATYGYIREGDYYKTENGGNGNPESDKTIVIFCHLGITFTMMSHLLGMSPLILWQGFFVAPTSVTVLTTEERVPNEAFFRVQYLGDTTHLHDGDEPISGSGYFAEMFQD
ncbi:MAG: histidine phosphatase family protein [Lachnospiraceae bacterium]|nr:histidine phosphatase family protein [Lachnospiraceae bacterium]